MFDRLDFVYMPSRDVAADLKHFTRGLAAEVVFAIEAFGTRVAMVRLAPDPPPLLFAGHLQGDQPVLVYRVADLEQAVRNSATARSSSAWGSRSLTGVASRSRTRDPKGSLCTSARAQRPTRDSPDGATSET